MVWNYSVSGRARRRGKLPKSIKQRGQRRSSLSTKPTQHTAPPHHILKYSHHHQMYSCHKKYCASALHARDIDSEISDTEGREEEMLFLLVRSEERSFFYWWLLMESSTWSKLGNADVPLTQIVVVLS